MNRRIYGSVLIIGLSATALAACGTDSAPSDTWTLDYSGINRGTYHSSAFEWWVAEVEARSDGRITVETFWDESLCPYSDALACVADGRADLAIISPVDHGLPIMTASTLPFMSNHEPAVGAAMYELYEQNDQFRAEWDNAGVIPLAFPAAHSAYLGTTEEVAGLDDLDGLQVRAVGYVQHAASAVGMVPASIAFSEIYESLERGVIDAWITSVDGSVSSGLPEVTDHVTALGTGVLTSIVNPAISKDVFDSMPTDVQDVILEVSAEYRERFVDEFFVPAVEEDCAAMMSEIESFTELPESEVEQWRETVGNDIADQWIETVEGAGVSDAAGVLDAYRDLLAKNETAIDDVDVVSICNNA